jgi:hypothetical protein
LPDGPTISRSAALHNQFFNSLLKRISFADFLIALSPDLPYLYDIFTKSGIASLAVVGPRKVGRELYAVLEVLVFSSGYAAFVLGHGNCLPPT